MKVGLAIAVRFHPERPYPLEQVYADFIDDCLLAEELGFDFAWFGEHHFTPDRWVPSPIVFATHVAAKTTRLRVGTCILCLPFHDPLRVAEDVAVADVLSGGRFDFGVGVGSQWEEFHVWGIPPEERFGRTWESVDLIERCWREDETFSHHGKYYRFEDVTFTTKPLQSPVPIWVGAMGPQSVANAAKRGYHLLAPNVGFDDFLLEAGRDPSDHFVAPMCQVALAEDAEEARRDSVEGLRYFLNFYMTRRDLDGNPPPPGAEITAEMLEGGNMGPMQPQWGTPDDVRGYFEALASGRYGRTTHLPLGFRHAGMSTEATHRSMRLFAEHLLPLLHQDVAVAGGGR